MDIPQNLSVDVTLFVSTQVVSALSTFQPPNPPPPPAAPPDPPVSPTALPTAMCLCGNECPSAADGVCDDDGPGGVTSANARCHFGKDCHDCGPRKLPVGAVVVSPFPGIAGSAISLDQLRDAQLECVLNHSQIVIGYSNTSVDRIGRGVPS